MTMFPHPDELPTAPEGAEVSAPVEGISNNGGTSEDHVEIPVKVNAGSGGAMEMAVAAFGLSVAALALAVYVYITREIPK